MPQLSGIYDSAPIQPVAKIKENLSILTGGNWHHYRIEYIEPMPPGPANIAEMVTLSGATALAANGTIQKRVVAILQLNQDEFMHIRFEPLDNVEGLLWEQAAQSRFASARLHCRVDRMTRFYDPYLATTTFFIMGSNRDFNLEVRNPMGYATPTARFMFFGEKYILYEYKHLSEVNDKDRISRELGQSTWLPAEGLQSLRV